MKRHRVSAIPVSLLGKTPFARGGGRECYFHPTRPDRCLKVLRPERPAQLIRAEAPWLKRLRPLRHYDQNARDLREFTALFRRFGKSALAHCPDMDGMVPTDKGPGLCMELIRDTDGRVSLSLKEWILENGASPALHAALDTMIDFHVRRCIHIRDPFPHNVVVQRLPGGALRTLFIDGLGHATLLPLLDLRGPLARRRIRKKANRLRLAVARLVENRKDNSNANGILLRRSWTETPRTLVRPDKRHTDRDQPGTHAPAPAERNQQAPR